MTARARIHHVAEESRGLQHGRPDDCLMGICGASGDLTHRSLIPSIQELARDDLLPERFAVLGFAIDDWSDEEFRRRMAESIRKEGDFDEAAWRELESRLFYLPGDFTSAEDYRALSRRIEELQAEREIPDHVFFHLATPPSFFGEIARRLGDAGLTESEDGWRRLAVEKPFGVDRRSASELHAELQAVFDEERIYRIDHFLGKETVQNLLVFRFANPAFEPIWNHDFIDHIQITVAEDIGIGTRAAFYEKTGVIRDMIQNHLLQFLCLTAVEPPVAYDARSLRDETAKVLQAIRPPAPEDCVRGQYDAGEVGGEAARAYRDEDGVDGDSTTATFAALRLTLDNWRWAGVPFYLRTGKRMARKLAEIAVFFKPTPHLMFPLDARGPTLQNVLVFRLQPEEGILQTFVAKQPGPEVRLTPVTSRFLYADAFHVTSPPRAYAWLILDVMLGDQTLFAREDWIDRAWSIVDPLIAHRREAAPGDVARYAAGSWGPEAADDLLRRDGRAWRNE